MTRLKFNLLFLSILAVSISAFAGEPLIKKELTRELTETFDVSSGVNFGVHNKYGDINITTWNKNQIQVDVLMKVKSSNTEKAQKFLDGIKIDFQSSSSKVTAKTVYPDQKNNSWWSNWFGNGKNIDYEVHYTIHAPADMNTSLINKYGNISQTSIDGNCSVTNKYGDIFFEDVADDLTLNLGYGKATIGKVGNATFEVKYSSIKIDEARDMTIATKYSKIKINQCARVTAQTKYDNYEIGNMVSLQYKGKYDDFKIGTIEDISVDTKYTDIRINTLHNQGIFDTGYGSVVVRETGQRLKRIAISSKYTKYGFVIPGDFHLTFDGSHSNLHINKPYEKYVYDKDGSDLKVKAYRGSKEGGTEITAKMKYGGLDID